MTDMGGRPVLVAGATGRQGGSVVRHLLQRRLAVRALVQNPHSDRAKALADQGIEIAQGDMDDLASLKKAMAGVHGVYSVQDYFTVGAAREVQEGKNMAGAALDAGVEHFVFSSVGGAERNSGIHHFETKWEIENHIRKLGLPATMIRPAGFMENYYIPPLEKQLLKGRLLDPIRAGKPLQTIASDDIGKFISLAFAQPDRFIGLELEIAGSELTRPDTAEVFSRVLGRRVKAYPLPLPLVGLSMGKEWYQMFAWLNKNGFQADIPALRRDYPDVPLTSLEEWLRREGWAGRREITVKRDSMGRPASAALPVSADGPSRRPIAGPGRRRHPHDRHRGGHDLMNGTITITRGGTVTIHTYTSPPEGWLVNTHILEGPTKLIIFDGQLVRAYADEAAAYAVRLNKPVDRIILSHPHPDHWSGLEVLTARFPQAEVQALPGVTELVRAAGEIMLGKLQPSYGDKIATRVTVPSGAISAGPQTFDGARLEFREYPHGESDVQLMALLPEQQVMLAFDLVFASRDHAFTLAGHFDNWVTILETLKEMPGYDTIIIGHDTPTDPSAFDATIAYLKRAKEIYAASKDGQSYASALKAAFPGRAQPGWVDFSGMALYSGQRV